MTRTEKRPPPGEGRPQNKGSAGGQAFRKAEPKNAVNGEWLRPLREREEQFARERRQELREKRKWQNERDDRRYAEWLRMEDYETLYGEASPYAQQRREREEEEERERRRKHEASIERKRASFLRGDGWVDRGQEDHDREEALLKRLRQQDERQDQKCQQRERVAEVVSFDAAKRRQRGE